MAQPTWLAKLYTSLAQLSPSLSYYAWKCQHIFNLFSDGGRGEYKGNCFHKKSIVLAILRLYLKFHYLTVPGTGQKVCVCAVT